MRLIDTREFPPKVPVDSPANRRYAILSHCWRDYEITLSDLRNSERVQQSSEDERAMYNRSWDKIKGAQKQADEDGLAWIWIDTLCIDKTSSAELSEAINSMYRWYQGADVCYVHLEDLNCPPFQEWEPNAVEHWTKQLRNCKWFRRGWTLQELIAPAQVQFYNQKWVFIAELEEIAEIVSDITRIHLPVLQNTYGSSLHRYSIAQRILWAAFRETTRPEDRAYSLLGILDLSMDARYGEGKRAFERLQEEIIARSDDESILAWEERHETAHFSEYSLTATTLLASSPDDFAHAWNIVSTPRSVQLYRMTSAGLQTTARIVDSQFMILNCRYLDDPTVALGLHVEKSGHNLGNREIYSVTWKRPTAMSTFQSRLGHMDVFDAVNTGVLEDVIVERQPFRIKSAPAFHPSQQEFTVWLRLDKEKQDPEFSLERSVPPAEQPHGNVIWLSRASEDCSSPKGTIMIDMVVRHRSSARIGLRLTIKCDHGTILTMLGLRIEDRGSQKALDKDITEYVWAAATSPPIIADIPCTTSLHFSATLQKKIENDSDIYLIRLWSAKSKWAVLDSALQFLEEDGV